MPTYFIDLQDGDRLYKDSEGENFVNFEDARKDAVMALSDVSRNAIVKREHQELTSMVRDANGSILYQATLSFHGKCLVQSFDQMIEHPLPESRIQFSVYGSTNNLEEHPCTDSSRNLDYGKSA